MTQGFSTATVEVSAVTPGTTATRLGKAEDAAHASGDVGVMMLVVRKATPANLSGADGDYEPLQMSAGRLWVSAVIDTALPAGTAAIGKLAANSGVDIGDVDVTSIAAGDNNIGNVDIASIAAGDNNIGNVDVVTLPGVAGTVAHDAADSGNPVKIGGKARTTNPTAVADADRVDAFYDDVGRKVVVPYQCRDLVVHQPTTIATSTAETTILDAGAAGVFHDLTMLTVTNQSAAAVNVTIKDDTAGTTRMILALGAVGSNSAIQMTPVVPITQAAAAKPWTATLSVNTVTVNFFVQAVKNV